MPIALRQCPVCAEPMVVREFYCTACDVTIRGEFEPGSAGPFSQLNDEQLAFLHLFVTSRGNMSDVERSLGVSYPTVRAKLDDLIAALTDTPAPIPAAPVIPTVPPTPTSPEQPPAPAGPTGDELAAHVANRRRILTQISEGKLSAQEGMEQIRKLPGDQQ